MKDPKFSKYNDLLNQIPLEEMHVKNEVQLKEDESDFQELKLALENGMCCYCKYPLTHFSEKKICFHWLLWMPKGLKKKHFALLFKEKSYHELESYLRWVANTSVPIKNINNLVAEKKSNKFIETTIKYKNIEWSFSCSHNDLKGHENAYEGRMPHYHFQMKINDNVVINFGGFHIPFQDYDDFSFAVKRGEFDRLRGAHIQGAGMQELLERFTPEELVNNMRHTKDDSNAEFRVDTMITADEGNTISGDEIADLLKERDETGVSMAKLVQKLKNVKAQTFISIGDGVPKISSRKPNRGKKLI